MYKLPIAAALATAMALPAFAQADLEVYAAADVTGADNEITGSVTLNDTASGMTLVRLNLTGVPEGTHAIHLHETGDCSADDFSSAGGHIAGDKDHGVMSANGPHPGDMPNVIVGADGMLKAEVFLAELDLEGMIDDADGAAFIMHSGPDDYTSQPAGDAGSRIACGVFEVK